MTMAGYVIRECVWGNRIFPTMSLRHFSCSHCPKLSKNKNKSSSSNQWLMRQRKDRYVRRAQSDNYRCRSAYKLIEIDDKYRILHPGKVVIDCGASPGSWCQVAVERVNSLGTDPSKPTGKVIGIDLQHIAPIAGAHLLSVSDFTLPKIQEDVRRLLQDQKADVILSDMAPNATGMKSFNHDFIIGLCFTVLHFSLHTLQLDGALLCKLWMGREQDRLKSAMDRIFRSVQFVKPQSSRNDSAEVFCLAKGFQGLPSKE